MSGWRSLQSRLPLLDSGRLERLRQELGADVVQRLLILFIEDLHRQEEELKQALAAQAFQRLSRCCHTLKSVCGSYGVLRCQFLAEKLEVAGRQGDDELISDIAPVLLQQLAALKSEMAQEIQPG